MAGRYKLGPDGVYYDANDEGPDQASPEQIQQYQASQGSSTPSAPTSTEAPESSDTPYMPPSGNTGVNGGNTTDSSGLEDKLYQMNDQLYSGGGIASPYTPTGEEPTLQGGLLGPNGLPSSGNTGINGGALPAQASPTATTATSAPGAVPAGFDAAKWNDPNKHDPKYDVGRMVAAGASEADVAAMMAQKYPDYKYLGGDKFQDKDGNIFDFEFDREGARKPMWELVGGPGAQAGQSAGTGAGQGVAGVASTGGFDSTLGGNPFGSGPVAEAIMRLLGRGEARIDPNDPNIAGPTAAFRGEVERAGRRSRNAMAERAAAEGLNYGGSGSGSFDSAIQSELESEGMRTGQYRAQLQVQEIAARRQDVVNALQFAQGQEKLALEQYLAQLNDQLQRAQMGQQNQQFYDQFSYNIGRDNADRDAAMARYLQ